MSPKRIGKSRPNRVHALPIVRRHEVVSASLDTGRACAVEFRSYALASRVLGEACVPAPGRRIIVGYFANSVEYKHGWRERRRKPRKRKSERIV
jgi:hypothetical protein